MKTGSHFLLALVAVALAVIEAPAAGPQASEFPMAAVPSASVNRPGLPGGGRFEAVREPQGDVKAYPPLKSEKPLYGRFTCGSDRFGRRHFDFVIDESGGTGAGYDRLYVDVNGNRDLRDDRPVSGAREVPNQPKEGGTGCASKERDALMVRPARMARALGSALVPSPKRLNFGPIPLSKGGDGSPRRGHLRVWLRRHLPVLVAST